MTFPYNKLCKKVNCAFLLLLLVLGLNSTTAQIYELGLHGGYNFTKLTVEKNKLNDEIFVKSGRPYNGFSMGGQFMISPPLQQSSSKVKIIHSVLMEASLCRCGANVELSLTSPNGGKVFRELRYLFYRGDYSIKYVGTWKKLQLLVGPTVSNRFYTGVRLGVSDNIRYAGDQFKPWAFGYEIGAAAKMNTVQLSLRYNRVVGAYGKETELIPTKYKNYQIRVMLHYYFLKKHKGQYWDSIYWK